MKKYIVQYVGFATTTDKDSFIHRWTPFATQFKTQGILSTDLYEITQGQSLSFISRNVWESDVYMAKFPTGMATGGGGGGIKVKQMGSYWIKGDQLEAAAEMKLIFLDEAEEIEDPMVASRKRIKDGAPYVQMLDFPTKHTVNVAWPFFSVVCKHIKTM